MVPFISYQDPDKFYNNIPSLHITQKTQIVNKEANLHYRTTLDYR